EAVDDDSLRDRIVPGIADGTAGIVGAVAGDIDDAPGTCEGGALEALGGEIEPIADGRVTHERARRRPDLGRDHGGAFTVADHGPVDHHLLLADAGPFDEAYG